MIKISCYPFLSEAKEWVKKRGISIEEILEDIIYERARYRGLERVRQAMIDGIVKDVALVNEVDIEMEIYSYAIARMIVVAFESDYALRRYALAEAKRAYEKMKEEEDELIIEILKEFKIEHADGKIHFSDYLKYAPTWDAKWKLVNREMEKGYVRLGKQEIARILQEAISRKIYNEMVHMHALHEVKKIFGDEINSLKKRIAFKKEIKKGSISDFPPCISSVISSINSGKNVPHVARFALVAFLNEIGMSDKEMLALFSKSPDFNEEKALYQIHHITGKISGTVYSTPKCSTIRTWGFCFPDENCKGIFHPVMYYRRKK